MRKRKLLKATDMEKIDKVDDPTETNKPKNKHECNTIKKSVIKIVL